MINRELRNSDTKSIKAIAKATWRATYSSFIPEEIQDKVLDEAYSESEMTNRFVNYSNLVAEENGEIMVYAFLRDKKSYTQLFVDRSISSRFSKGEASEEDYYIKEFRCSQKQQLYL